MPLPAFPKLHRPSKKTPDIIYEDGAPDNNDWDYGVSDINEEEANRQMLLYEEHPFFSDDEEDEKEPVYLDDEEPQINTDEVHAIFSTVLAWSPLHRTMIEGTIIDIFPDGPNDRPQYTIEPLTHGNIFRTSLVEAI